MCRFAAIALCLTLAACGHSVFEPNDGGAGGGSAGSGGGSAGGS